MDPIFPISRDRSFVVISEFEAWRDESVRSPQPLVVEIGDILHICTDQFYLVRDQRRIQVRFEQPSASDLFRHSDLHHPRVGPPLAALSEIGLAPSLIPSP